MTDQAVPPPRPVRRKPAPIRVRVHRTERLGPGLIRVTFTGADMRRFSWPGPGSHLKVFLPEPGAADVTLPEPDADGMVTFTREVPLTSRTYTPRRFDPATGELDIDFVVHGDGPASRWASTAGPGDRAAVGIPRASYQIEPEASALVLAGDESALPAMATILATRPAGLPTTVIVEARDPGDRAALGDTAGIQVNWLERGSAQAGGPLESALTEADLPAGVRVWVATEAHAVRRIRTLLLDKHALPSEHIVTRGYWRTETANHPDHDFGEDEIPTR